MSARRKDPEGYERRQHLRDKMQESGIGIGVRKRHHGGSYSRGYKQTYSRALSEYQKAGGRGKSRTAAKRARRKAAGSGRNIDGAGGFLSVTRTWGF